MGLYILHSPKVSKLGVPGNVVGDYLYLSFIFLSQLTKPSIPPEYVHKFTLASKMGSRRFGKVGTKIIYFCIIGRGYGLHPKRINPGITN